MDIILLKRNYKGGEDAEKGDINRYFVQKLKI